jgi:hypothetical protein
VAWYLVKWRLFSDLDNTWEPEYHFTDRRIIEEFNQKHDGIQMKPMPLSQKKTEMTFPPRIKQNVLENKSPTSSAISLQRSPKESSPQRNRITDPFMKIEGLYLDPQGNFWFNI